MIVWKDFELADQILNPNTLTPDEEKEEEEKIGKVNENQKNMEKYEMRKIAENEEKMKPFEINTTIKKSKLYYFSFGEKNNLKLPILQQNFRQLPSHFKNKYVLSDIVVQKVTSEIKQYADLETSLLEYIDDNPPIWENMENELFALAISGIFSFIINVYLKII